MQMKSLLEARPTVRIFYQAILADIKKGIYRSGPEGRPSDAMILVLEGLVHYDLDDYSLDVKTGDFLFLSKGTVYNMHVKCDSYKVIIINFEFWKDEEIRLKSMVSPARVGKSTEKLFWKLLSDWQLHGPTVMEDCMSVLYRIYGEFLNATGSSYLSSVSRQRMNSALVYINEHLGDEDLSVPQIARAVHLSESHFRRSFKEAFQLSPIQYINTQRISKAKERIRYSSDSLSSIAEALGYSSVYHFSHVFKKEVGISPGEFRKIDRHLPIT